MIKIGINLLYLIPGKVGGTETYAKGLIEGLREVDKVNEYYLFCNRENRNHFTETGNFKVVALQLKASNRAARVLYEQLVLPFQTLKYEIDVLHSLGYVAPFVNFCPSLVSIYDLNWHFHPEDFSISENRALKFLVPNSAKACDLVVTSSNSSKKAIVDVLGVSKRNVKVVYGGVPKLKKPYSISRLKKLGIDRKYIYTVSASHPHKNLITLLKAFLILKDDGYDVDLVVVGLRGRAQGDVLEFIKNNKLSKRVKIMGWVSDKDLSTLYKYSEVVAFPSLHEGFGFPLVEAFVSGKPVVSSDYFSLKEVAGNAAVLIDPLRPDEIADGLKKVLDNPEYKKQLARKGKERSTLFSWEKSARETLKLYRSLVKK